MKRTYLSYVLVLLGGLLPSCKHDEVKPQNQELIAESIPYFASEQEYAQALDAVGNMLQAERDAYEAQRGYQSIGSASERFYQTIDFESLQSEADFHQLVADHGDYLQLVEDEDGELTLETRYYNHPARYLINREGMVLVGDTVVKVFEEGTFKAHRRDLQQVASLQRVEDCPAHLGRFVPVKAISKTVDIGAKAAACGGPEHVWRSTNGNNRLKAHISITVQQILSPVATCELLARPYKRTLGVWFWCSRTMKVDATVTWGYTEGNVRNTSTMVFQEGYKHDSKLERKDRPMVLPPNYKELSFDSFNVWIDSYSTAPIHSVCP